MSSLSLLAKRGELDRLSLQFSQFVSSQSGSNSSPLVPVVAALLSEQALQGNVCIKLGDLPNQASFVELLRAELPGIAVADFDAEQFRNELLSSTMV